MEKGLERMADYEPRGNQGNSLNGNPPQNLANRIDILKEKYPNLFSSERGEGTDKQKSLSIRRLYDILESRGERLIPYYKALKLVRDNSEEYGHDGIFKQGREYRINITPEIVSHFLETPEIRKHRERILRRKGSLTGGEEYKKRLEEVRREKGILGDITQHPFYVGDDGTEVARIKELEKREEIEEREFLERKGKVREKTSYVLREPEEGGGGRKIPPRSALRVSLPKSRNAGGRL